VRPDSAFCHNCGIRLTGPFCAACGQKARPLDLTVHEFLHDFTHELLHVDGRIFQSIRRLLASPGFLTREHLQGRRASWISPIRLYLIFSIAFFALSAMSPAAFHLEVSESDGRTVQETVENLGYKSVEELREAVSRVWTTWVPRVMFVLVPLFAWLVGRAYRRIDGSYLHHLYFALHVHAAWFAAAAVGEAAEIAAPANLAAIVDSLVLAYGLVYVYVALRRTYGGTRRTVVRAMMLVLPLYGVALVVTIAAIVLPVAFHRLLWS
jgi:hypothetical protein